MGRGDGRLETRVAREGDLGVGIDIIAKALRGE